MTTRKLSSEKLLDTALLKNLTRRRLPHILVAFLVNFFTVSVPFMMWMGDLRERLISGTYTLERYIERAAGNVQETLTINLVFMFILGIYLGLITLGYMMKRRSAHFYHALPQRRETLYTTSIVSALICAVIGGAINLVIALAQMAVYSLFTGEVLGTFFILVFKNIVYFLVAYAITVFAGSFSGNGLVQALMSLVIMFYPLATYTGIVLMRSVYTTYFWADHYYDQKIMQWLSPATYAGWNYWGEIKVFPTVIALLVVAALLLGGMAIYRKRAIENSERPIVFKKLGHVLKYMFMFTVTMYVGMFFQAMGYGAFYMFFGFFSGALLSFMLFNTILAKSPKAMFKGIKGLIIFAVVFALFTALVCFDITGFDDYVPAEDNVAFADIEVSGAEYENTRFEDPEILAALSRVLQNQHDANKNGVTVPLSDSMVSFNVYTVMYNKLGIPVARHYRISKYTEGAEEFLKLYADDERMAEAYAKVTDALEDIAVKVQTADFHINCNNYKADLNTPTVKEFADAYLAEFGTANYDRLSKPVVATVELQDITLLSLQTYYNLYELYDIDWPWSEFPIFADMTETIELLGIEPAFNAPTTYYLDKEVPLELSRAMVYDTRKLQYNDNLHGTFNSELGLYPYKEISPELANELALLLEQYNSAYTYLSRIFVAIDTDYVLRLCYGDYPEEYYPEEYYVERSYVEEAEVQYYDSTKSTGYYEEYTYFFPKGYVPDSVKTLFD